MSPKFVALCPAVRDLVRVIRDIVVPFLPRTTARTMPNLLSCGKRLPGNGLTKRLWNLVINLANVLLPERWQATNQTAFL
jgi:hypothetical protein